MLDKIEIPQTAFRNAVKALKTKKAQDMKEFEQALNDIEGSFQWYMSRINHDKDRSRLYEFWSIRVTNVLNRLGQLQDDYEELKVLRNMIKVQVQCTNKDTMQEIETKLKAQNARNDITEYKDMDQSIFPP